MEKFKAFVSRIDIPDHIAIDALMNTLLVNSKFLEDLYRHPTSLLQDIIARSHNFIRMEEDTKAIISKQNASRSSAPKNADTRAEPRKHASTDKSNHKESLLYVVDENNTPVSTLVVGGMGWNKYQRASDSPDVTSSPLSAAQTESLTGPSRPPVDLSNHCKYNDVKGHDTTECKLLYAQFLLLSPAATSKSSPLKQDQRATITRAEIKIRKPSEKRRGRPVRTSPPRKTRNKLPDRQKTIMLPLTRNNLRTGNGSRSSVPKPDLRLTKTATWIRCPSQQSEDHSSSGNSPR